jgi:prepilin-type N-terminal cleavage/methylation domain-containing protein
MNSSRKSIQHSAFSIQHSLRAMTLVELLVVLGIMGIIIGISVPGLAGYAKHLRLKTATRQIAGLVSLARSTAISRHEDHAVVIDPEEREIRVVTVSSGEAMEQRVRLPNSVTIALEVGGEPSQETQLVFRPSGSLTGRTTTIVLADQARQQTITVTGATGAISVQ